MNYILISRGLLIVDDIDYEYINQWFWSADVQKCTAYALRKVNQSTLSAHVEITQRAGIHDVDLQVDHIDGCGLNNQRSNLQMLSHADNGRKQRLSRKNTSGHRGVSWDTARNKWKAYLRTGGRMVAQTRHNTFKEAVRARLKMEAQYWQNDTIEIQKKRG